MLRWNSLFGPSLTKGLRRKGRANPNQPRKLRGELLEDRRVLAVMTVTDLSDGTLANLAGDGVLSLREAIEAINTGAAVDGINPTSGTFGVDDQIVFDPALFAGGPQTIKLFDGELQLTDAVEITGPGATQLTIDAQQNSRVINIDDGGTANDFDVTIARLTITGGRTIGDNENETTGGDTGILDFTYNGGGIRSFTSGVLTIDTCTIIENSTAGKLATGGGIFAHGDVNFTSSTVSGNNTLGNYASGGGIYTQSNVILTNSTIDNNGTMGNGAEGGGIFAQDDITLDNSSVKQNNTVGNQAYGGGISAGEVAITNSLVTGNRTRGEGGDVAGGGGIHADRVTLINSTISQNRTEGPAAGGGGIQAHEVILVNSIVSDNSTQGNYAIGGGIYASNIILTDSILSENHTLGDEARGGGIFATNNITLSNSTLSGNHTEGQYAHGGGLFAGGDVIISHSTITGNYVDDVSSSGGGVRANDGPITITNSIIAGNTAGGGSADLQSGTSTLTVNYSLIGVADGLTIAGDVGNLKGTAASPLNPLLGPLADNGGPTFTHALLTNSPAIDAGDPAAIAGAGGVPTFDQRGTPFGRVRNGKNLATSRIDMGAFELPPTTPSRVRLNGNVLEIDGDSDDDNLTLSADVTYLIIQDPAGGLATDIPGAIGSDTELQIPLAAITGNKVVVNALAGNDTLTVDFGPANSLPFDIEFNGGDPGAEPGDQLIIAGGTFATVTHTMTTTGPGKSGQINYEAGGDTTAIVYTGLEPVDMTGSTITNLVFNLPGTADLAILEDDGTAGNNISQIRSTNGTFETTTFSAVGLSSLTINLGNDDATFTVTSLPDYHDDLDIDGQGGSDTIVFQGAINLSNVGADLFVLNAEDISNSSGASIQVSADLWLDAGDGPITLADNATDILQVGDDATFITTGNVTIASAGTVNFGSLEVTAGNVSISQDSAMVLTALTATGAATITASSPLTINGNVTVGADSTFTATDSAGAGDDLTITATRVITANGKNLTFNAGDNFVFPANAEIINPGGTVTVNADLPDADAPDEGSTVSFFGKIEAIQLTLNGGDDNDTFIVAPSVNTPILVEGGLPTSAPGDRLIVPLAGIANAIVPPGSPTAGTISFTGGSPKPIQFNSIESLLAGTLIVDTLDDEFDGNFAPGDLSLREAIELANATPGADTITFAPSLTNGGLATILLDDANGELSIQDDLTITGPGANLLKIDAGNGTDDAPNTGDGFRIFTINGGPGNNFAVTIEGLWLTGGDVTGNGGAILSTETLTILNSEITNNAATSDGGGIHFVSTNGTLQISQSTFFQNIAGSHGGGIFSDTTLANSFTLRNSTISDNTAVGFGGGIFNIDGLTIIEFTTITDNLAPNGSGSGVASYGDNLTRTEVHSSIISGNDNTDVDFVINVPNSFESLGYNLIGNGNAVADFNKPGDKTGELNPQLFDLAYNGGPTRTHLPQTISPAVDSGDPAASIDPNVPTYDQRGIPFARIADGNGNLISIIDIGATEAENPINGPQVTGVSIGNGVDSVNVFGQKGPTLFANRITIEVRDLPPRLAANPPALNQALAQNPALYSLVGDSSGIIPIQNVNVILGNFVLGQPATASIQLNFANPLPDDRFTLTISDALRDTDGNRLDGESNASQPVTPTFPSGDGLPGGNFVARFTIDSRPEIGVYGAGQVILDTNGNFLVDPNNPDPVNRDLLFLLGFSTDSIFAGNFASDGPDNAFGTADDTNAAVGDGLADGFDKLAVYGRVNGQWRWMIDFNNDGIPDLTKNEPLNINGLPIAGNFDGQASNGDEVGLFDGTTWYFDTNHDFQLDLVLPNISGLMGYPVVGDFNGDSLDDLATYNPAAGKNQFSIARAMTATSWSTQLDTSRVGALGNQFGFAGVRERPVAGDLNGDGFDDLGLWVPDGAALTPGQNAQWYFLVSNPTNIVDRFTGGGGFVAFSTPPFGNDVFAEFGNSYMLPIFGNFDPPVVASTSLVSSATSTATSTTKSNSATVLPQTTSPVVPQVVAAISASKNELPDKKADPAETRELEQKVPAVSLQVAVTPVVSPIATKEIVDTFPITVVEPQVLPTTVPAETPVVTPPVKSQTATTKEREYSPAGKVITSEIILDKPVEKLISPVMTPSVQTAPLVTHEPIAISSISSKQDLPAPSEKSISVLSVVTERVPLQIPAEPQHESKSNREESQEQTTNLIEKPVEKGQPAELSNAVVLKAAISTPALEFGTSIEPLESPTVVETPTPVLNSAIKIPPSSVLELSSVADKPLPPTTSVVVVVPATKIVDTSTSEKIASEASSTVVVASQQILSRSSALNSTSVEKPTNVVQSESKPATQPIEQPSPVAVSAKAEMQTTPSANATAAGIKEIATVPILSHRSSRSSLSNHSLATAGKQSHLASQTSAVTPVAAQSNVATLKIESIVTTLIESEPDANFLAAIDQTLANELSTTSLLSSTETLEQQNDTGSYTKTVSANSSASAITLSIDLAFASLGFKKADTTTIAAEFLVEEFVEQSELSQPGIQQTSHIGQHTGSSTQSSTTTASSVASKLRTRKPA